MKELTTEQKAQRYDEALDRTIRFLTIVGVSPNEEPIAAVKRMSEYIFPELKESDDEKMRKGIIRNLEYLMDRAEGFVKDELKERIAWLEKQGNLMKALQISNARIGELIEKNYYLKEQLEKQGEQKQELLTKEKALKNSPFVEEKSAWSEEDDNCLSIIIAEFSKCAGKSVSKDEWMRCNDFLNSLKDRVGDFDDGYKVGFSAAKHNQWKPSDEQMDAVKSAALDVAKFSSRSEQLRLENEPYYKALMSLYNDLEKLREKWL